MLLTILTPSFALALDNRVINLNNNDTTIPVFLNRIKTFLVAITAGLAVLFVIFGGIKYIASNGNPERIEDAKKTLTYAIFGFILFLLVNIVYAVLQGDQFLNLFR